MRVKQYKGKVFGADFTAKERLAMNIEINRQIVEADRKYTNDIDAMVLYTLHVHLGFGKKRLRRFWEAFQQEHKALIEYYQMPDDGAWLCQRKLKDIGVDVEEWNKEVNDETENNKGKVHFIMVAGKDFVQNEMGINAANALIEKGEVTESKQFEGYPICVDGKYFFEGTYSKKKKKAAASPEVEPEDAPKQG